MGFSARPINGGTETTVQTVPAAGSALGAEVHPAQALCKDLRMAITRIDCQFFRGAASSPDQSSYVAINPSQRPGSMVMAGAGAVRESIGSHVASKLALQHFVDAVMEKFGQVDVPHEPSPLALMLLESAFKAANDSVYQFGHKLAAGGRLAASLIGLVIEQRVIAAGRVGGGNAYLCRDLEVFPFFESQALLEGLENQNKTDGFVGTQSMVSVELASVALKPRDVLFLSAEPLDPFGERELYGIVEDLGLITNDSDIPRAPSAFACEQLVQALYPNPDAIPYAMVAVVGPETVYLRAPDHERSSASQETSAQFTQSE